jgi:hypothetical protein
LLLSGGVEMDSEMTKRAIDTEPDFFSAFSVGVVAVGMRVVAPVFGPIPVLACLRGASRWTQR